jgi:cell division transport system ATP-binding protein
VILLRNVTKSYGADAVALDDVSLEVGAGECVVVVGPSGAGKTTLIRLLLAAEAPDAGELWVADHELTRLRRSAIPYLRRNLGIIRQEPRLLTHRSALENVAVGLEILGLPRREVVLRAYAALTAVGLNGRTDKTPAQLSGGEQQLVSFARALACDPAVLLVDEPTRALDSARSHSVLRLIQRANERGATVLITTHDPTVIAFAVTQGWRRAHLLSGRIASSAVSSPNPSVWPQENPMGELTGSYFVAKEPARANPPSAPTSTAAGETTIGGAIGSEPQRGENTSPN